MEKPMSRVVVRRDFLKCVLASVVVAPVLSSTDARAAGLPLLDPTEPLAKSLGFVPDAKKAAGNANPALKPAQHCGVCTQYQGNASDTTGECAIFAGHSVPSSGWCAAFQQRA
jgi:hypothetical protein